MFNDTMMFKYRTLYQGCGIIEPMARYIELFSLFFPVPDNLVSIYQTFTKLIRQCGCFHTTAHVTCTGPYQHWLKEYYVYIVNDNCL